MKFNVVYSDRRTVSISVKGSDVTVRAPHGMPEARIDKIVSEHKSWIEKQILKQMTPRIKDTPLTEQDVKALRKSARTILKAKTEHFAKIMNLKYGRITITGAKTRFGSCNSKGNISYSYLLMLYPEDAVDYVVVHELAHLIELNHSPAFYNIVASVFPDYKRRAKLLKL